MLEGWSSGSSVTQQFISLDFHEVDDNVAERSSLYNAKFNRSGSRFCIPVC